MLEVQNQGPQKAKTQFLLLVGMFLLFVFSISYFFFDYRARAANAPSLITYQGKILVNGSAASTTLAMYFLIYDASAGGNILYTASGTIASPLYVSTTPSSGLFSINLGDTTVPTNELEPTIFQNNAALYLEVRIGAQTLSPRKRITASPYAFNALYLGGVAATSTASSSTYIPISTSDGSFNFNTTTIATTTISVASITSSTISNLSVTSQANFTTNVGIRASVPTVDLDVRSANTLTGATIRAGTSDVDKYFSLYSGTAANIAQFNYRNPNGFQIYDSWNGFGYLGIKGNGNIIFGAADISAVNPSDPFTFYDGGIVDAGILIGDNTTSSSLRRNGLYIGQTSAVPNGMFYVDASGNMYVTGTSTLSGNLTLAGSAQPTVSGGGSGRIYFDTGAGKFKVSQNGGAYADLVSSGGITGGSAAGQITYWDGAAWTPTSTVYVTSTTSGEYRVGINSSTPNYTLSVNGTGYFSGTTTVADLFSNPGKVLNPVVLFNYVTSTVVPAALQMSNDLAYVMYGSGEGIEVLDTSDHSTTTFVGVYNTFGDKLSIQGHYVYFINANTLSALDVADPKQITLAGTYTNFMALFGLAVQGKYAYVGDSLSRLSIVDISDPDNMYNVSMLTGLESGMDIKVAGNYLYYLGTAHLYIIDISDPVHPVLKSTNDSSPRNLPYGLDMQGHKLYIANADGLRILDAADPTTPVVEGDITAGATQARTVNVAGDYAYVGTLDGMYIFNVSSSTNPVQISTSLTGQAVPVQVKAGSLQGNYLYLATNVGFYTIDVGGSKVSNTEIGAARITNMSVMGPADFGQNLNVRGGLTVGDSGLLLQGDFGMYGVTTNTLVFSTTTVFVSGAQNTVDTGAFVFNAKNFDGTIANSIFKLQSNSASQFVVQSDGKVGIGTTTPYAKLSIEEDTTDLKDMLAITTSTAGLIFKVDSYGRTYGNGPYSTPAADYAEYYYTNDTDLANEEIVCLDTINDKSVRRCTEANDPDIIGAISTKPSVIGNNHLSYESNPHYKIVSLLGQVPVKVSVVGGEIKRGDKLTSSNLPGVAMKATQESKSLGVALENYSGEGVGTIMVAVASGWHNTLYQGLSVNSTDKVIKIGNDVDNYGLVFDVNKLSFSSSTLFESTIPAVDKNGAFVFNAANFSANSPDNYILSLRSNNQSVFSVASNGDVQTIGDIYASNLHLGASGQPGDLAEKVDIAVDDNVEAGDVLMVDNNQLDTYRRSAGAFEQAVAGVVSTNPTIVVGNGRTDYTATMAMVGRVLVKVSNENGSINRGDLLVTASTTGYAMKYDTAKNEQLGMVGVIGVALEPWSEGKGKIMALIRTGWAYSRNQTVASLQQSVQELASVQGMSSSNALNVSNDSGQLVLKDGNVDFNGGHLVGVTSITNKDNKWAIDTSGRFITRIQTSAGSEEMYSMQSPVSEFVFSSSSQLVAGEAKINFLEAIKEIIDFTVPLKISVTLTSGEAKGVYVSAKDVGGFTVRELEGGGSNATFDWMVVAKRREGSVSSQPAPTNDIVPPVSDPPAPVEPVEGGISVTSTVTSTLEQSPSTPDVVVLPGPSVVESSSTVSDSFPAPVEDLAVPPDTPAPESTN